MAQGEGNNGWGLYNRLHGRKTLDRITREEIVRRYLAGETRTSLVLEFKVRASTLNALLPARNPRATKYRNKI